MNGLTMEAPPDEYYCWVEFDSTRNFDVGLWKNFRVAVKFGRHRWPKCVLCNICGKLVGWSGCTGNLRKHLSVHHGSELLPPEIQSNGTLRDKVERLSKLYVNDYASLLETLIRASFKTVNEDHEDENKRVRYPIWNFYRREKFTTRSVKCRLCQRDIYWNQGGLEKLVRHVHKVHLLASQRCKIEELYRFCILLGIEVFIEKTKRE